jgi:hypothetical protein
MQGLWSLWATRCRRRPRVRQDPRAAWTRSTAQDDPGATIATRSRSQDAGIPGSFGLLAGVLALGFAQRWTLELDAVGAVDGAVADGVGEGGVADDLVPGLDGELAGDEGGGALVAVLDDLEEVAAFLVLERREAPVVDDEQLGAGQACGSYRQARVTPALRLSGTRSSGQPPKSSSMWTWDHAQIAWPTAPWTAHKTRRPQAPQALLPVLSQEVLIKGSNHHTHRGGEY